MTFPKCSWKKATLQLDVIVYGNTTFMTSIIKGDITVPSGVHVLPRVCVNSCELIPTSQLANTKWTLISAQVIATKTLR